MGETFLGKNVNDLIKKDWKEFKRQFTTEEMDKIMNLNQFKRTQTWWAPPDPLGYGIKNIDQIREGWNRLPESERETQRAEILRSAAADMQDDARRGLVQKKKPSSVPVRKDSLDTWNQNKAESTRQLQETLDKERVNKVFNSIETAIGELTGVHDPDSEELSEIRRLFFSVSKDKELISRDSDLQTRMSKLMESMKKHSTKPELADVKKSTAGGGYSKKKRGRSKNRRRGRSKTRRGGGAKTRRRGRSKTRRRGRSKTRQRGGSCNKTKRRKTRRRNR